MADEDIKITLVPIEEARRQKADEYSKGIFGEAKKLRDEGKSDRALSLLDSAIEEYPNQSRLWSLRGWIRYQKGHKMLQARSDSEKALELNPKSTMALNTLAWLDLQQGYYADAEKNWLKLLDMNDNYKWAYPNLSYLYSLMGNLEKAEAWAKICMERYPDYSAGPYNLGLVKKVRKNYFDAEKLIKRGGEMGFSESKVLNALGDLYCRMGNKKLGLSSLEDCISKYPGHIYAYKNLLHNLEPGSERHTEVAKLASLRVICVGHTVKEYIGSGASGIVFRVEEPALGARALKIIYRHENPNEAKLLDLLKKTKHPAFPEVYQCNYELARFGTQEVYSILMEFVEGEPINRKFSDEETFNHGAKLFDALKHMKECGITHRDLNQNNIIITNEGPKIIDFGIASDDPEADAIDNRRMGGADSVKGCFNDVISLGSILYYMVTGHNLFNQTNLSTTRVKTDIKNQRNKTYEEGDLEEILCKVNTNIRNSLLRSIIINCMQIPYHKDYTKLESLFKQPERRRMWRNIILTGIGMAAIAIGALFAAWNYGKETEFINKQDEKKIIPFIRQYCTTPPLKFGLEKPKAEPKEGLTIIEESEEIKISYKQKKPKKVEASFNVANISKDQKKYLVIKGKEPKISIISRLDEGTRYRINFQIKDELFSYIHYSEFEFGSGVFSGLTLTDRPSIEDIFLEKKLNKPVISYNTTQFPTQTLIDIPKDRTVFLRAPEMDIWDTIWDEENQMYKVIKQDWKKGLEWYVDNRLIHKGDNKLAHQFSELDRRITCLSEYGTHAIWHIEFKGKNPKPDFYIELRNIRKALYSVGFNIVHGQTNLCKEQSPVDILYTINGRKTLEKRWSGFKGEEVIEIYPGIEQEMDEEDNYKTKTMSVSAFIRFTPKVGLNIITATIDPDNKVDEIDETNNYSRVEFEVGPERFAEIKNTTIKTK